MCPRSIYPNGFGGISIAAGTALAYFTAGDTTTGTEVWRTDGTAAGTFLLFDIRPGTTSSQPSNFVVDAANQLFFSANDGTNGEELWKSDGTTANTTMIKNINVGPGGSGPNRLALWNNLLFFTAYDGAQTELWRSDGFVQNTTIVKDLTPTPGTSSSIEFLTPAANALFFTGSDGTHKGALFKTDGTSGGTVLVKSLSESGGVYLPVAFGTGVLFLGSEATHGGEPWFSDGTEAGTRMIKDIAGAENDSTRPAILTALNGQVLSFGWNFGGAATGDYYGLYRSDGSVTGTLMLKSFSQVPTEFDEEQAPAIFKGALYFPGANSTAASGPELWRSDGTAAGTAVFADINPGLSGSYPRWLTPSGDTLFFQASNSANGSELWKTNGTPETTALVKDIIAGINGAYPEHLVADGAGGIYFTASDATAGRELWRSDGTSANTRMLLDLLPGNSGSDPKNLTLVGSNLFFTARDAASGRELWVTNGTPEGTRRVRDITLGTSDTSFASNGAFAVVGSRVFFVAASDLFGSELWASDGSESGTAIVKDIYPGAASSDIQELTAMSGALYFAALDSSGRTLWRSNGTTAGTARVASGASAPVNPESLRVIDGRLYFSAADQAGLAGRELWVSDGTAAGTRRQQDLNPGPASSNPRGMVKAGDRIYLGAYKPGAGVELWSAQLQQPQQPQPRHPVYLPLVRR